MLLRVVATSPPLLCALCHDALLGERPCPGCGAALHVDCRAWLDRCPSLGCPSTPRRVIVRRRLRSFWRELRPFVIATALVALIPVLLIAAFLTIVGDRPLAPFIRAVF